jgi:type I restriction enzyme R subunit
MAANFDFLRGRSEYALFAEACIEAERVLSTSPAMAAVGCRKALELAVKWVYAADNTIRMPYRDNLQSLIHEPSFRFAVDSRTWKKLPYIIKLGNLAVHTEKTIDRSEAVLSLAALFEFIQWIDYCYGTDYEERTFDESRIPSPPVVVDEDAVQRQNRLLEEKEAEIEALRAQIAGLSEQLTAAKQKHQEERRFTPVDLSEFMTRKKYIDVDLKLLGWTFGEDVLEEVPLVGMPNGEGTGYADYVLYGKDGLPLAVIEAKRASKDPKAGTQQAKLYADCLERMTGRRPMMFVTNGFETYFWDDLSSPQRQVSGIFSRSDLEKLMQRRTERKPLTHIPIDDRITDRYYQKEAVRAVCEHIEAGHRKALLVMATGTGKTRTAASLVDVLSRGGYVTNVLFLADRIALVRQAKDSFKNCLPEMSLCNLLDNRDDKSARIVFSTYPTMLNAIDTAKSEDGKRLFTPAHFDLIIIDEAHRSIFKKYRAIFEYFDAILVGLTATPKTDVHRNTYEFFELENGVPTYAYEYETAVKKDHVLVPYYNIEVTTKFLAHGITYDELSEEDKERYEEDFTDEEGHMPDEIPASELNAFIFNQSTVDTVLQDLMTKGIKVAGGDRIGKTIIFAQNKRHAEYIVERFNKLYPQYKGHFARRVTYDDPYALAILNDFKVRDKEPHIAVSVDMMDTGIDVPEVVNLVFFKRVRSKAKFWQMIGRGTRLCKDLFGPGQDKTHFVIFDYLGNFEFFRQHQEGLEGGGTPSLTEAIFAKRIRLIAHLQHAEFADEPYRQWRAGLVDTVVEQIRRLNPELIAVKMKLEYVEKYKHEDAFLSLTDTDQKHLIEHLGPLVYMDEPDEHAKRFDNLMYGLMLGKLEQKPQFQRNRKELTDLCAHLAKRATIPQIKDKLELIRTIQSPSFWQDAGLLDLEHIRIQLRKLVKFIVDEGSGKTIVYTNLTDEVLQVKEGQALDEAYHFEDYKLKVNRYIEENKDHLAIYKLRHNLPLTAADYESLERIFTSELGTAEDYRREFKDTPFGLLVRKIAKMEYAAAMEAFSEFINDQSLTQAQIVFVKKVIDYIVQNGYIDDVAELTKPPFDKPQSMFKLFDSAKQKQLVEIIKQVKENAVKVV